MVLAGDTLDVGSILQKLKGAETYEQQQHIWEKVILDALEIQACERLFVVGSLLQKLMDTYLDLKLFTIRLIRKKLNQKAEISPLRVVYLMKFITIGEKVSKDKERRIFLNVSSKNLTSLLRKEYTKLWYMLFKVSPLELQKVLISFLKTKEFSSSLVPELLLDTFISSLYSRRHSLTSLLEIFYNLMTQSNMNLEEVFEHLTKVIDADVIVAEGEKLLEMLFCLLRHCSDSTISEKIMTTVISTAVACGPALRSCLESKIVEYLLTTGQATHSIDIKKMALRYPSILLHMDSLVLPWTFSSQAWGNDEDSKKLHTTIDVLESIAELEPKCRVLPSFGCDDITLWP